MFLFSRNRNHNNHSKLVTKIFAAELNLYNIPDDVKNPTKKVTNLQNKAEFRVNDQGINMQVNNKHILSSGCHEFDLSWRI